MPSRILLIALGVVVLIGGGVGVYAFHISSERKSSITLGQSSATPVPTTSSSSLSKPTPSSSENTSIASSTSDASSTSPCTPVALFNSPISDVQKQTSPLVVNEYSHVYNIHGTNVSQLRDQMNQCGPKKGGSDEFGYTMSKWNAAVQNNGNQNTDGCSVSSINIGMSVDYFLPNWVEYAKADQGLKTTWDTFLTALTNHEQAHGQIAKNNMLELQRRLGNVPATASCGTLNANIKQVYADINAQRTQQDADLDAATQHDQNQSVSF